MSGRVEGGCLCGACRYVLDASELPLAYACHCRDCQSQSGSAFALQAPVPDGRLSLTGAVTRWVRDKADGSATTSVFCAACLTRIHSFNDRRLGMSILRAGTLDRSDELAPSLHIWTRRRQPWIALPAHVEAHEENAPADRVAAIFAPNFA